MACEGEVLELRPASLFVSYEKARGLRTSLPCLIEVASAVWHAICRSTTPNSRKHHLLISSAWHQQLVQPCDFHRIPGQLAADLSRLVSQPAYGSQLQLPPRGGSPHCTGCRASAGLSLPDAGGIPQSGSLQRVQPEDQRPSLPYCWTFHRPQEQHAYGAKPAAISRTAGTHIHTARAVSHTQGGHRQHLAVPLTADVLQWYVCGPASSDIQACCIRVACLADEIR